MSSMTMRPITPACLPRITPARNFRCGSRFARQACKSRRRTVQVRWSPMKALRSFTVRPQLPTALAPLHELAMNLRWSWDDRTRDLFRWVDPDQWEVTGHDPVRLLGLVRRE